MTEVIEVKVKEGEEVIHGVEMFFTKTHPDELYYMFLSGRYSH